MKTHLKGWVVGLAGVFLAVSGGCVRMPVHLAKPAKDRKVDMLAVSQDADLERSTEVQLVEQMGTYRNKYQSYLEHMVKFYDRQGNQLKSRWASEELTNMELGPRRAYLVVAEVSGSALRATDSIHEADLLYQEGINLMRVGVGKFGRMAVNERMLYQAIEKFNGLITSYPSSDKIDDAAFQIGQIYHHYLKDYTTALLYYQRVWQWDEQTMLPVRYWVGRIYDDHIHDRVKAIEFYEKAIQLESSYPANVVSAKNRIKELSKTSSN
ncbi:MAG: tetratricopeptide repeat protein [Planctomycetes bacterium]|nr:tetratricopeptide repeat protein [Planctomycetota bacterium]